MGKEKPVSHNASSPIMISVTAPGNPLPTRAHIYNHADEDLVFEPLEFALATPHCARIFTLYVLENPEVPKTFDDHFQLEIQDCVVSEAGRPSTTRYVRPEDGMVFTTLSFFYVDPENNQGMPGWNTYYTNMEKICCKVKYDMFSEHRPVFAVQRRVAEQSMSRINRDITVVQNINTQYRGEVDGVIQVAMRRQGVTISCHRPGQLIGHSLGNPKLLTVLGEYYILRTHIRRPGDLDALREEGHGYFTVDTDLCVHISPSGTLVHGSTAIDQSEGLFRYGAGFFAYQLLMSLIREIENKSESGYASDPEHAHEIRIILGTNSAPIRCRGVVYCE